MKKIFFLKFIDAILGKLLCKILSPKPATRYVPTRFAKILYIRPGGIGDAVLLLPSIITLKHFIPGAEIDILAETRNCAIFSLCPEINRVILYASPTQLLLILRKKYDVVIDAEQWHRLSAVIARLTGAPMIIGYSTNERKRLFTHPIVYSHDDYEMNSFFRLLTPLMGKTNDEVKVPFLSIPSEALESVRLLLNSLRSTKVVALFPGASIRERKWGSHKFRETATRLSAKGYSVVVIGGKEEISDVEEIVSGLAYAVNFCGKTSLVETAAILKESVLLITGDSGIMHIAYGLGTPTVSLFGPGIEKKWAPRGENVTVINKHLPCSPCTKFGYTPRCDKGAECMKQITVDEVYEKAIELLER